MKIARGARTARAWPDFYAGSGTAATWTCLRQGWGIMGVGRSLIGRPIRIGGRTVENGFGTHAESEIRVRTLAPMRRFEAWVGWDDNENVRSAQPATRVRFSVWAGGREIGRSPDLACTDAAVKLSLALPAGTAEIVLKAETTDGDIRRTHVDWAEPALTLAAGGRVTLGHAEDHIAPPPAPAPFSFRLNGVASSELLPHWERSVRRGSFRKGRAVHTVTWRQPDGGLECRLELEEFKGFPAVEWVLYLRNHGKQDTPVIESIQALDAATGSLGTRQVLHRSVGSLCKLNDFEYRSEPLIVQQKGRIDIGPEVRMVAGGGRSSNNWLPFFNLEGEGCGVITAIGWSGQWAARVAPDASGRVILQAGMEETHLKLRPGEEIRSPRILLLFWDGERLESHNLLRRFILAHHSPRLEGKTLKRGPLTVGHWGGMKTPQHLERIAAYRKQKLEYDYYWVDAGWYGPADSYSPDEFKGDWWKHVGDWSINPAAHPDGLRPVSDAARQAGMKFLLWFEPERARAGTPWVREHPEWFLEAGEAKTLEPERNLLFNLGDPAARRWLTEYLLDFMKREGVDLYRQDFNFEPLPYWRFHDAPDRKGMTEIRYVEGLYAFWDELLERHPGLVIDNCASGGRRIDLETVSRSIALWRSDWQCRPDNDPIGGQVHGMGLSYWLPLHGTGAWACMPKCAGDSYRIYSVFAPAVQFSLAPYAYSPLSSAYPWAWHRRLLREMRRAQPLFLGDYYPVAGLTTDPAHWSVYQMNRPDLGEGLVMALRRPGSAYSAATIRLQGLRAAARYVIETSGRVAGKRIRTGRDLMENGLEIRLTRAPDGCVVFYKQG